MFSISYSRSQLKNVHRVHFACKRNQSFIGKLDIAQICTLNVVEIAFKDFWGFSLIMIIALNSFGIRPFYLCWKLQLPLSRFRKKDCDNWLLPSTLPAGVCHSTQVPAIAPLIPFRLVTLHTRYPNSSLFFRLAVAAVPLYTNLPTKPLLRVSSESCLELGRNCVREKASSGKRGLFVIKVYLRLHSIKLADLSQLSSF